MLKTRQTETREQHAKIIAAGGLTRLGLLLVDPVVFLRGILVLTSLLASTATNVDQGYASGIAAGVVYATVGGGSFNTASK